MVGMDIDDPPVDFVALATSMGVTGRRVGSATEAADAVHAAWSTGRPALIEIPIAAR
jgi:benzoylformate decarboxylase